MTYEEIVKDLKTYPEDSGVTLEDLVNDALQQEYNSGWDDGRDEGHVKGYEEGYQDAKEEEWLTQAPSA